MPRKKPSPRRSDCPLNAALEAVGDPWALLVVRDLMFKGICRYSEFLGAGEGVATNVLAARLRLLEREGIITRERDPADARRQVYRLTPKGIDLAPVLVDLVVWGARHYRTGAPAEIIHRMETAREEFLAELRRSLGDETSR
jgi:DNA-binding HxlR family transcriptional regulator